MKSLPKECLSHGTSPVLWLVGVSHVTWCRYCAVTKNELNQQNPTKHSSYIFYELTRHLALKLVYLEEMWLYQNITLRLEPFALLESLTRIFSMALLDNGETDDKSSRLFHFGSPSLIKTSYTRWLQCLLSYRITAYISPSLLSHRC